MRSSAVLFKAFLLALATANPHPANWDLGNSVVSRHEPGSLVARADGLSPEIAQLVADNGVTTACYSSTYAPIVIPFKMRKRQDEVAQETCPVPTDDDICADGFIYLCCYDNYNELEAWPPVGLIQSHCDMMTAGSVCPPENRECCLNYTRNPLSKLNPEEYKGWGSYCYNPEKLLGPPTSLDPAAPPV